MKYCSWCTYMTGGDCYIFRSVEQCEYAEFLKNGKKWLKKARGEK